MSLSQQVTRIDWIETAGEIGALLREADLIKKLQPIHNRRLRRNTEVCAWRLAEHAKGLWKPELVSAEDIDFGRQENLFGLFKHSRDAQKLLQGIAEEHGLCPALLGLEKAGAGKPCFAYQVKKCRGACVGKESASHHSGRLIAALGRFKLKAWPHPGPACIRDGEEAHLVEGWRYLGTARSDAELWELLESPRPAFDGDIYKILARVANRLAGLGPRASAPDTAENLRV
jgi:DNA polymerase-3 subunit epsilon